MSKPDVQNLVNDTTRTYISFPYDDGHPENNSSIMMIEPIGYDCLATEVQMIAAHLNKFNDLQYLKITCEVRDGVNAQYNELTKQLKTYFTAQEWNDLLTISHRKKVNILNYLIALHEIPSPVEKAFTLLKNVLEKLPPHERAQFQTDINELEFDFHEHDVRTALREKKINIAAVFCSILMQNLSPYDRAEFENEIGSQENVLELVSSNIAEQLKASLSDGGIELLQAAVDCPSLKVFSIQMYDDALIIPEDFYDALSQLINNINMQQISINVGDSYYGYMKCMNPKQSKLVELNGFENDIHALAQHATQLSSVTHWNLYANKIQTIHAHYLADLIKNNLSLVALGLGTNELGNEGVKILAASLPEQLAQLDLSCNDISDEALDAIAKRNNSSLTHLICRGNPKIHNAAILINALSTAPIKELSFAHCNELSDETYSAINQLLKNSPTLESINIQGCNITPAQRNMMMQGITETYVKEKIRMDSTSSRTPQFFYSDAVNNDDLSNDDSSDELHFSK